MSTDSPVQKHAIEVVARSVIDGLDPAQRPFFLNELGDLVEVVSIIVESEREKLRAVLSADNAPETLTDYLREKIQGVIEVWKAKEKIGKVHDRYVALMRQHDKRGIRSPGMFDKRNFSTLEWLMHRGLKIRTETSPGTIVTIRGKRGLKDTVGEAIGLTVHRCEVIVMANGGRQYVFPKNIVLPEDLSEEK